MLLLVCEARASYPASSDVLSSDLGVKYTYLLVLVLLFFFFLNIYILYWSLQPFYQAATVSQLHM